MMNSSVQPAWAVELLKKVDLKNVATDMEHFEKDDKWLRENLDRLRKEYPDKFVAVYDRKVVAVTEALQDAREKAIAAGIDPAKCVIQLILTKDYVWVF